MQQPLRNRAGGAANPYPSTTTDSETDSNNNYSNNTSSNNDGTMDLNSSNQFESLKREATKLERQLEEKVAKYQQLAQKCHAQSAASSKGGKDALNIMEQGQTIGPSDKDQAAALQHDIQRSMQALQDWIATRLDPAAETSHQMLVVKRFREILFDLTGDYSKAQQVWQRSQERMELFKGANRQNSGGDSDDPGMDSLMRERNHIQNSSNMAGQTLAQASQIRADLASQRMGLGRVSSGIGTILSTVPGLNTLIGAIQKKRSKDDKILAGVIASCILFTLWYLFN